MEERDGRQYVSKQVRMASSNVQRSMAKGQHLENTSVDSKSLNPCPFSGAHKGVPLGTTAVLYYTVLWSAVEYRTSWDHLLRAIGREGGGGLLS